MKLSTRTRYGVRALVDLAIHSDGSPVQLREIAEREEISEKYLEHLMSLLKSSGFVRSIRGSKGGYLLARDAREINLREVVDVLEGSLAPVECVTDARVCDRADSCVTRDVWGEIQDVMNEVLESITLQELCRRKKDKEQSSTGMYYI